VATEDAALDLSMACWDVDKEDLDSLIKKRQESGKFTLEVARAPTWKEIGDHCRRYVKPKQEHAQCLEDVRSRWKERKDWAGRRLWTEGADKALDGVIKEVLAGLYEGTHLLFIVYIQMLRVASCNCYA
jgi:hypothetical protein